MTHGQYPGLRGTTLDIAPFPLRLSPRPPPLSEACGAAKMRGPTRQNPRPGSAAHSGFYL